MGKRSTECWSTSLTGVAVKQLMGPEYRHYGFGRDGRLWYAAGTERERAGSDVRRGRADGELMEDAANPYEQIPELKDHSCGDCGWSRAGVMRKPTR